MGGSYKQVGGLLEDLQKRRVFTITNEQTSDSCLLPPWLPNCSDGFGAFASEILPNTWNPPQPCSEMEEHMIHQGIMQSWDKDLLESTNPRRKGWWIKQCLTAV